MSSSPPQVQKDAHEKALSLNLDSSIYGTLAEIGAGQEVSRWFLSVGAASGTVAKTISAYDKTVSDDIYGAGTRYVSKERLQAMLDYEYKLLLNRLHGARGKETCFFAFADTVAARNYQGTNEQHGWLGIRFQTEPGSQPSDILLHINLRESTAQLQQQAIGILGVNLIYAAFHQRSSIESFSQGCSVNCRLRVSRLTRESATLLEMTIHHIGRVEAPAIPEMLDSIQQLTPRGTVIVSDYAENYLLTDYLRRHSTEPVRLIQGVATTAKTLHEAFYQNLPGTLLEGVGRLLATNVKLYVAPMPRDAFDAALTDLSGTLSVRDSGSNLVTLADLMPSTPVLHLFEYLRASGRIVELEQAC